MHRASWNRNLRARRLRVPGRNAHAANSDRVVGVNFAGSRPGRVASAHLAGDRPGCVADAITHARSHGGSKSHQHAHALSITSDADDRAPGTW